MPVIEAISLALLAAGLAFFIAGTAALVRFPDLYCRLHAVTKADNVGLGLTLFALALRADSALDVVKLGLIWVTVLIASASVCYLIANEAHRRGVRPWTRTRT